MLAEAITIQERRIKRDSLLEAIGGRSTRTHLVREHRVRITLGTANFFNSTKAYKTLASAKATAKRLNAQYSKM